MTWTKICGFRTVETARRAVELGASAIGLNFFPKSVRFVEPNTAREIVDAVAGTARCVGLFVNEPVDLICETMAASGVDLVQLHGRETPGDVRELKRRLPRVPIIKAFAVGESLVPVADFLIECRRLDCVPDYVLLDAQVAGEWGGTGQTAPWDVIAGGYLPSWPPLVLAGGLNATNVREAIEHVRPWGVDVASGVEIERGIKDAGLMTEFMSQVNGL